MHLHKKDFFRCRKDLKDLYVMVLLVNTSSQSEENLQLEVGHFSDYYIFVTLTGS